MKSIALILVPALFIGCNKDDDDPAPQPPAKEQPAPKPDPKPEPPKPDPEPLVASCKFKLELPESEESIEARESASQPTPPEPQSTFAQVCFDGEGFGKEWCEEKAKGLKDDDKYYSTSEKKTCETKDVYATCAYPETDDDKAYTINFYETDLKTVWDIVKSECEADKGEWKVLEATK